MRVVPIITHADVLLVHIIAVHALGFQKNLARALVIAQAIKNVAGHVDHVSRPGRELAEFLRAFDRPFRMVAPFHRMDPIVIRGGVVGIIVQQIAQTAPGHRARRGADRPGCRSH